MAEVYRAGSQWDMTIDCAPCHHVWSGSCMSVSGKQPQATSSNRPNATLRRHEHRIILTGNHGIAFRNQATIRMENSMVVLTYWICQM